MSVFWYKYGTEKKNKWTDVVFINNFFKISLSILLKISLTAIFWATFGSASWVRSRFWFSTSRWPCTIYCLCFGWFGYFQIVNLKYTVINQSLFSNTYKKLSFRTSENLISRYLFITINKHLVIIDFRLWKLISISLFCKHHLFFKVSFWCDTRKNISIFMQKIDNRLKP